MVRAEQGLHPRDGRHTEDPQGGIDLVAAVMPEQVVDPGADADAAHALIAAPRNAEIAADVRQVQLAELDLLADVADRGRRAKRMTDPDAAAGLPRNMVNELSIGPG